MIDKINKNKELVESLILKGYCKERVARALLEVPREKFVRPEYSAQAYEDMPLPIGYGQTISAPSVVAFSLERLDVREGMNVLDIGTGSGYVAAILSFLVGKDGRVTTIERKKELLSMAKKCLSAFSYAKNIKFVLGDGTLGYGKNSPYDRIIAGAAAPEIPPPLISQLKENGKMVIPVGDVYQDLVLYEKKGEGGQSTSILPVIFVKMIGKFGFKEE
ncbi:MAG: protein-L-isoaspartate(D-aspartate) O-methyltransferase [Candidatus Anstonellales archaeon]